MNTLHEILQYPDTHVINSLRNFIARNEEVHSDKVNERGEPIIYDSTQASWINSTQGISTDSAISDNDIQHLFKILNSAIQNPTFADNLNKINVIVSTFSVLSSSVCVENIKTNANKLLSNKVLGKLHETFLIIKSIKSIVANQAVVSIGKAIEDLITAASEKELFVHECASLFLADFLKCICNVQEEMTSRRLAARSINLLVVYSELIQKQFQIFCKNSQQQLLQIIIACGDYGLQQNLVESLFRWKELADTKKANMEKSLSTITSNSTLLADAFFKLKSSDFDGSYINVHKFIDQLNTLSYEETVVSIFPKKVLLNDEELPCNWFDFGFEECLFRINGTNSATEGLLLMKYSDIYKVDIVDGGLKTRLLTIIANAIHVEENNLCVETSINRSTLNKYLQKPKQVLKLIVDKEHLTESQELRLLNILSFARVKASCLAEGEVEEDIITANISASSSHKKNASRVNCNISTKATIGDKGHK